METPSSCLCTCGGKPLSFGPWALAGRLSDFEASGLPLALLFPSLSDGIFGLLASSSFLLFSSSAFFSLRLQVPHTK